MLIEEIYFAFDLKVSRLVVSWILKGRLFHRFGLTALTVTAYFGSC